MDYITERCSTLLDFNVSCSVTYVGHQAPVITFLNRDTHEVSKSAAVTHTTNNMTLTYSLSLKGVQNGSSIVCKLHFVPPMNDANINHPAEYTRSIELKAVAVNSDSDKTRDQDCLTTDTGQPFCSSY